MNLVIRLSYLAAAAAEEAGEREAQHDGLHHVHDAERGGVQQRRRPPAADGHALPPRQPGQQPGRRRWPAAAAAHQLPLPAVLPRRRHHQSPQPPASPRLRRPRRAAVVVVGGGGRRRRCPPLLGSYRCCHGRVHHPLDPPPALLHRRAAAGRRRLGRRYDAVQLMTVYGDRGHGHARGRRREWKEAAAWVKKILWRERRGEESSRGSPLRRPGTWRPGVIKGRKPLSPRFDLEESSALALCTRTPQNHLWFVYKGCSTARH